MRSAPQITPTFHPPENDVSDIGATILSRIASTVIMRALPSGSSVETSGWVPESTWAAAAGNSLCSTRETSSAQLPRTSPTIR